MLTYTPYPQLSGDNWLIDFPASVPPCVEFLGRYLPDGFDFSVFSGANIHWGWPIMTNPITLTNAIELMNYTQCTVSMSATVSWDWTYSGFYIGDVPDTSNGSISSSMDFSYTFTGIPSWGAPLSGVIGDFFASPRFVPTQGSYDGGYGGFNYTTWFTLINGGSFSPYSGVTVGDLAFEVARNESGNAFRVLSLYGGGMTAEQWIYATVTPATYDDDGNVSSPTQFSTYLVPEGAFGENDSDVSLGAASANWYLLDNLSGWGGSTPSASGNVTIAGTEFAWVGNGSYSFGNLDYGFTVTGLNISITPTITFT